jgi:AcrR family transcriptional regulator
MNIISNDSIHNLTIKNITTKLGISEPALYKHFKNKSDILLAILEKYELFFNIVEDTDYSPIVSIMNFVVDRYNQLEKNRI